MLQVPALSIVEAVAADLRKSLFSGDLTSDAQLTEAEVSANYGVARPTAKAAIEKLVAEGLLHRGLHKTARVPVLGREDVRDLCLTRSLIETELVVRLAEQRLVPSETMRSHAALKAIGPGSGTAMIGPVVDFHVTLVQAIGSPRTSRLYGALMGEMRLCMTQMQARRILSDKPIIEEHERIIDRIAAGDPDGAARELRQHLRNAELRLCPADLDDKPTT